jgi:hypothetical protein
MATNLCDLLEHKLENVSVREKTKIFIATIHLQQDPILNLMYKIITNIPYDEFALSAMSFFKNKDSFLQNEQNLIIMTRTGGLP